MTDQQNTDVAVVEPAEPAYATEEQTTVMVPTTPALQKMAAEAAALDTAFKMAQSLSKTNAVPQRYQQSFIPKGEQEQQGIRAAYDLAAAIMFGAELGMSALQSAQNVFPVHGQPSVYARTMVAQVRKWIDTRVAQGAATADPETGDGIWEVSASPTKVIWAARRDGRTASAEWTYQRAETAGFTKNEKYTKQPTEMLRAKAMTEVCRILFQDVLLGMAYSVEELQLSEGVSVQVVRPVNGKKGVGGLEAMLAERKKQAIEGAVVESESQRIMSAAASKAMAEVNRHPAEPGPADQSVEQAPLPEPDPIPAPGVEPGQEEPAVQIDASGDLVNSQGEIPASKAQLVKVRDALKVEKRNDPHSKETLEYLSGLVTREVTQFADISEGEADEIVAVISAAVK